MVVGNKKGVPDWLNNPLWSSPSPSSSDPQRTVTPSYSSSPSPSSQPQPQPQPRSSQPGTPTSPSPTHRQPATSDGIRRSAAPEEPGPSSKGRGVEEDNEEEDPRESYLLAEFKTTLSKRIISLGELRRLACQGIPDGAGIRPTVWKILLGYLPHDRALWAHELEKKRSQYSAFKDELLLPPSEITRRLEESAGFKTEELNPKDNGFLRRSEIAHGDHPLSLGQTSVWNKYFQESEIVEQIDRDVKRTHPEMQFFSADSSYSKSNQDALRRILIIFAKLNPGIRYVQGMNEVLAPLFYVFKNDPDASSAAYVEADTFFCFVELLSGFRDNFCKQLDNSVVGIRSTINKLSQLLKRHDEELWRHLEVTTNVNPQFYAFRWITLLLTQEFNFDDCLHIWDTLLGDPEGPQETLLRICCAMLILVRKRLLAGDFTSNLKLLQNFPTTNIGHLLHVANKLRGPVVD